VIDVETLNATGTVDGHAHAKATMNSSRLLKPVFVAREKEFEAECSRWEVEYKPPLENESPTQTKSRRLQLTRAIDKHKKPSAAEAQRAARNVRRRLDRQSLRCSDPDAYEALKAKDAAAQKRSRHQSLSPSSKRPRDADVSNVSTDQGEPMAIDPPPTRNRSEAAGDEIKYEFMDFVENADEFISKAEREAKNFDQCFRVGKSNSFKVHACAVCDRIIKGTAKPCFHKMQASLSFFLQ